MPTSHAGPREHGVRVSSCCSDYREFGPDTVPDAAPDPLDGGTVGSGMDTSESEANPEEPGLPA